QPNPQDDDCKRQDKEYARGTFARLASTPLIGIAAFRRIVLERLADTTEQGKGSVDKSSKAYAQWASAHNVDPDKSLPFTIRVCDSYAKQLSQIHGAPSFEYFWPEKERDATIGQFNAFFSRYGDRYQFTPESPTIRSDLDAALLSALVREWSWNLRTGHTEAATPAFPRLGRPATPQDVAEGRAIFSLAGVGEARIADIGRTPLKVRWLKAPQKAELNWFWRSYYEFDLNGRFYLPENEGFICQAEDLLVDGQWRRFYGVALRREFLKIPEEELEFPANLPWSELPA